MGTKGDSRIVPAVCISERGVRLQLVATTYATERRKQKNTRLIENILPSRSTIRTTPTLRACGFHTVLFVNLYDPSRVV